MGNDSAGGPSSKIAAKGGPHTGIQPLLRSSQRLTGRIFRVAVTPPPIPPGKEESSLLDMDSKLLEQATVKALRDFWLPIDPDPFRNELQCDFL